MTRQLLILVALICLLAGVVSAQIPNSCPGVNLGVPFAIGDVFVGVAYGQVLHYDSRGNCVDRLDAGAIAMCALNGTVVDDGVADPENLADVDLFVFYSYRYYQSFFGLPTVRERAVLSSSQWPR